MKKKYKCHVKSYSMGPFNNHTQIQNFITRHPFLHNSNEKNTPNVPNFFSDFTFQQTPNGVHNQ
uniref:Uncharacterized protein n=1 Tax=Rhizophora mucronata TaxID=61149 RepID=A0A2P2JES6_RHIMU